MAHCVECRSKAGGEAHRTQPVRKSGLFGQGELQPVRKIGFFGEGDIKARQEERGNLGSPSARRPRAPTMAAAAALSALCGVGRRLARDAGRADLGWAVFLGRAGAPPGHSPGCAHVFYGV